MRRLGSDVALVAVAAGGAAAIVVLGGYGFPEFLFVGCLLGLLLVALRQAGRVWLRARAEHRRAGILARTSPTEAALAAADHEAERMAADIQRALSSALDGIGDATARARAVPAGDEAALGHLAAIQRHGLVATTELRRMLGLLRAPAVPSEPAGAPPSARWLLTGRAVLMALMVAEIVATALLWGEGNGVAPEPGPVRVGVQVGLSVLVVLVFFAPVGVTASCMGAAAILALGMVAGAPVLDGLWLGVVLAFLTWRTLTDPARSWPSYAALVVLWACAAWRVATHSPGNLGIHAVMVGAAAVMAVIAQVGERLGRRAQARVVRSEGVIAGETERAVRDRRLEIARELHDALSGTVGVIVAQAGAAEVQWTTRPDRAQHALAVVADAVDDARRDLRAMAPDRPGRAPGIADIPALVARMRAAGVAVDLTDLPTPPPGDAGAAAYRIVQECLANAARHAPGARVTVDVGLDAGVLHVGVADDGPGLTARGAGGYGLTGLRERVHLLGGTLTLDGGAGGLRVSARLPVLLAGDRGQEVR